MAGIPISITKIPFVTEPRQGPRIRTSKYFLTMSTNVRFDTSPQEIKEYADRLVDGITEVFTTDESIRRFIRFPQGKDGVVGRWDPQYILNADVEAHAEIGHSKYGQRLHTHLAFTVTHRCNTRLDLNELKIAVNANLERRHFPWPIRYLHCRVVDMRQEDYMRKQE